MTTRELLDTITEAARQCAKRTAATAIAELLGAGSLTRVSAIEAEQVSLVLIKQRWFDLASRFGRLAAATFPEHRGIGKRYGQSLIEVGCLARGREEFERLLAIPRLPPADRYEYEGFIGRTFKQQFVNDLRNSGDADPACLHRAIDVYRSAYDDDTTAHTWHGINAVALLAFAARRGLAVSTHPDFRTIASNIIDVLKVADAPSLWDEATWAEACVALGDWEGALAHTQAYLWQKVSPFALGSTLRQFEEIWGIDSPGNPGAPLVELLRARLLELEDGSVRLNPSDVKATLKGKPDGYEKVFGKDHFTTLHNYRTGLQRCAAVARIGLDPSRGDGTGFLMRGADLHTSLDGLVLVTNAHVIDPDGKSDGLRPHEARVVFQALDGVGAEDSFGVSEVVFSSPKTALDITIVRLQGCPSLPTPPPVAAAVPSNGARVIAIGHPSGGTLSLSLNDNELLDSETTPGWKVHYRTPTEGGSSGSPIFSKQWELVAVHHYGGDDVRRLNGCDGRYAANEGTSIHAVRRAMAAQP